MTKPVKVILCLAAVAVAAIWLYPSWIYVSEDPTFGFQSTIGSYWLFAPPMPYGAHLDCAKNITFTALVLLAASGLVLWSRWIQASRV